MFSIFNLIFAGPTGDRICSIYLPSLTADGGVMYIPSGTQNVILYCICRRNHVAAGPTYWFIDGNRVTLTTASGDDPYSRNNVPAPLFIPLFTGTSAGTYGCSGNTNGPHVTIDLSGNSLVSYYCNTAFCLLSMSWFVFIA